MSELQRSIRSPLTLLDQWRDRADGARLREVVILGYTVDLAFLERFLIPTARALGARVTVLGDARRTVHDPVDVRRAGSSYQHGHAQCARAFHPKLVILAGDQDSVLAVGSGNPTLSGWGYNRELWLTASTSRQLGPELVVDVADWLQDLPDVVTMPSWIAATLRHVAGMIRPSTVDGRWSSVRAAGNLHVPLLDQLAPPPVVELRLAAPFYDPKAQAVAALIKKLKPKFLRIAIQEASGTFDGERLVDAAERVDGSEFRVLEPQPARHGKLVEWDLADGTTGGMTGSANLTASAMLLSTTNGGNCELAVIADHAESLFPAGDPRPAGVVRNLVCAARADEAGPADGAPVLLGCVVSDGLLLVELARPTEHPVIVETSLSAVPGTWLPAGIVPVGKSTAHFVTPGLTGGAVRAVVDQNGVRQESAIVFITDTSRCRPRNDATDQPRLQRSYQPFQLFTDPALAQRFSTDLERLVELAVTRKRSIPNNSTLTVRADTNVNDRWADYLEECERTLGAGLVGLIFPPVRTGDGATANEWSIDDADDGEIADGEDEAVLDHIAGDSDEASSPAVPSIRPDDRDKYRRFASRWVYAVAEPTVLDDQSSILAPVPLRMAVTALYLTLLAAGVWREDQEWRSDLRWLIWSLVPDDAMLDQLPGEAFGHIYALLAVAMTTLRQGANLHGGREGDLLATDAWQECSEWVAEADIDLAERLLLPSTQPFACSASAQELRNTIQLGQSIRRDPYAEALATLADGGLSVRLEEGVWWVDGDFGNVYRVAARVATDLNRVNSPTVVVARSAKGTVLIATSGTMMAMADFRSALWRLYPLSGIRTPLSLASDHMGPPPGAHTLPLSTVPPEVHALSRDAGVDLAALAQGMRKS